MITAKTNDDFTVELEEDFLNDADLIEKMSHADTDGTAYFYLRDRMLTEKDRERLYAHLRNEKGIVPFDKLCIALNELLSSFNAGKNSSSSPN